MVRIWEALLQEQPALDRLPPIVPVVLSQSPKGFAVPAELTDLLAIEPGLRTVLAPHLINFRVIVDDLAAFSDEDLRRRQMRPAGLMTLLALKHAWDGLGDFIEGWADLLREQLAADPDTASRFLSYTLDVDDRTSLEEIEKRLVPLLGPDFGELLMTTAQSLRDEGRQEGRQEGARLSARRMLLLQLEARFGEVPARVRARVEAAGTEELDRWAVQVVTAKTLDEVLSS